MAPHALTAGLKGNAGPERHRGVQGEATFNATELAEEAGSGYANIPVLGALAKLIGTDLETAVSEVEKSLSKKLPPEVVDSNIEAMKLGYNAIEQK